MSSKKVRSLRLEHLHLLQVCSRHLLDAFQRFLSAVQALGVQSPEGLLGRKAIGQVNISEAASRTSMDTEKRSPRSATSQWNEQGRLGDGGLAALVIHQFGKRLDGWRLIQRRNWQPDSEPFFEGVYHRQGKQRVAAKIAEEVVAYSDERDVEEFLPHVRQFEFEQRAGRHKHLPLFGGGGLEEG